MKPSDGVCNMVLNAKGIPDVDPQDPDCFTSTNACRVAAKAMRELNSGVTDCLNGQSCEGNPINPGSGVKFEQINLYRGQYPSPLNVELQFLHVPGTAFTASSYSWRNPYNANVQILTDNGYTYGRVVLPPYSPNQFSYFHKVGSAWVGDPGSKITLTEVKNASGVLTGFKVVDAADTTYGYTLNTGSTTVALLSAITTHDGRTVTITTPAANQVVMTDYLGHNVSFTTNGVGLITTMTTPDGKLTTFTWDSAGTKLLSIQWPDSKVRSFLYENTAWPNALTGITDENGNRYATWTYDTAGKATGSWHGNALNAEKTTLTYNSDGSVNATDLLGGNRTYQFTMINGLIKTSGLNQPCTACGTHFAAATYDANGNIATKTDFNGNKTTYSYDLSRNLETSRTEGLTSAGTTTVATRTITTAWNPSYRLPTLIQEYAGAGATGTPLKQESYSYDSQGNLLSKTISDTQAGTSRTWLYTYNSYGQVLTAKGPRTDVNDVMTYTYYDATDTDLGKRGNVATVADPLGHVTRITAYDLNSRPLTIIDPNGLTTTLTYDARGRMTSRKVGSETTTYTYDGVGQLTQLTLPDSSSVSYTYDAAHRLTDIRDSAGNTMHYTLDAMGNHTQEDVKDPNGVLAKRLSRSYDALNRLQTLTGVGQE